MEWYRWVMEDSSLDNTIKLTMNWALGAKRQGLPRQPAHQHPRAPLPSCPTARPIMAASTCCWCRLRRRVAIDRRSAMARALFQPAARGGRRTCRLEPTRPLAMASLRCASGPGRGCWRALSNCGIVLKRAALFHRSFSILLIVLEAGASRAALL